MKFKVGDRVKFLNDVGAGVITGIVEKNTVLVRTEDDFEVPALLRDLVIASGSYEPDEEIRNEPEVSNEKSYFNGTVSESGKDDLPEDEEVVLAFLPVEHTAEYESYLINSSSYYLKFTISRDQAGEQVLFSEGTLEPGIKMNLGNYVPGKIAASDHFRIQGIFYNEGFYKNIRPMDLLLEVSSGELLDAGRREINDYFHDKAILYILQDWKKNRDEPAKINPESLKEAMLSRKEKKKELTQGNDTDVQEVDLHIENLVENPSGMDPGEILDIQMARFRTALETAMIHHVKKIILIHGIGNGKLKHEIRRVLDREYGKLRYQDASFREYGYGATLVLL